MPTYQCPGGCGFLLASPPRHGRAHWRAVDAHESQCDQYQACVAASQQAISEFNDKLRSIADGKVIL